MYSPDSMKCSMPNSASPISQARIDREDALKAHIAAAFQNGNQALSDIIARLTPPVPTGKCADFTSSLVLAPNAPWPDGMLMARGTGLGRVRRGVSGWDQMLPTGNYSTPQPGFQYDVSDLIPVWGCAPQPGSPATSGPPTVPSVSGTPQPAVASSCWPWPCLLLVLAGLAAFMPSGKKSTGGKRGQRSRK